MCYIHLMFLFLHCISYSMDVLYWNTRVNNHNHDRGKSYHAMIYVYKQVAMTMWPLWKWMDCKFPLSHLPRVSCGLGLLNIQIYSGLHPADLIRGEIIDPPSGNWTWLPSIILTIHPFTKTFFYAINHGVNLKSRLIIIANCAGRRFKASTVLTPRDVELVAKVNCEVLDLIWRRNVPMIIICSNNDA